MLHEMSISQGFRAMDSTEKTVTNSNRMLEFLSATAFTAAWVGNYINTSSKKFQIYWALDSTREDRDQQQDVEFPVGHSTTAAFRTTSHFSDNFLWAQACEMFLKVSLELFMLRKPYNTSSLTSERSG